MRSPLPLRRSHHPFQTPDFQYRYQAPKKPLAWMPSRFQSTAFLQLSEQSHHILRMKISMPPNPQYRQPYWASVSPDEIGRRRARGRIYQCHSTALSSNCITNLQIMFLLLCINSTSNKQTWDDTSICIVSRLFTAFCLTNIFHINPANWYYAPHNKIPVVQKPPFLLFHNPSAENSLVVFSTACPIFLPLHVYS